MTRDEFEDLLSSLADDWSNSRYEKVALKFAEDVFYSDAHNYTFNDRSALLAFFRDDDGHPQYCRFHNSAFDEVRQVGAAEYTYEGTSRYHGTAWIRIQRDEITVWREYQHRSEQSWEEFWK